MPYLILPQSLLEIEKETMSWRASPTFLEWCDENFREPYSFGFMRSERAHPFSRYNSACYMLNVSDEDAALTLLKFEGVQPGNPDEDVEENKAERDLFR